MNQREQIKNSLAAYLYCLNPSTKSDIMRYSIYLVRLDVLEKKRSGSPIGSVLEVLWPDSPEDDKDLLPFQVYSRRNSLPAFHFVLDEVGTSHVYLMSRELKKINPDIEVYFLGGKSPTNRE